MIATHGKGAPGPRPRHLEASQAPEGEAFGAQGAVSSHAAGALLAVGLSGELDSILVQVAEALGLRVIRATGIPSDPPGDLPTCDVVVIAISSSPGAPHFEICQYFARLHPQVPVLLLAETANATLEEQALQTGVYELVFPPLSSARLQAALARALEAVFARRAQPRGLPLSVQADLPKVIGTSPALRRQIALAERVAASDSSVVITGESGTGKELVARLLHAHSPRRNGPFVAVNCSAIPETLLEAELFGARRGAYTDARRDRPGLFLRADKGTLFLDEIAELPLPLQPKLLRVLEVRSVRPVGSDREVSFDARIVCATNTDLEAAVAEGRFRQDLYYRLQVVHIEIPPLRERGADILLLARHFLHGLALRMGHPPKVLSPKATERLLSYGWPGNVRELRNAMERANALTAGLEIDVCDLPPRIAQYQPGPVIVAAAEPAEFVPLREIERRYIGQVLRAVGGNRTIAARVLGLDRKTLYRKILRYGLSPGTEDLVVEPTLEDGDGS